ILLLAEQYNLQNLKDHCLNSVKCVFDMRKIMCYGDFDSLSDATKAAICGRMKELIFECGNCMTHGAPDPTPTPVAQPRMVHSLQTRGGRRVVPISFRMGNNV
ncbi:hypothetical protein PMAYCL1PPCAC_25986, partial [Pristionchus mayeri]